MIRARWLCFAAALVPTAQTSLARQPAKPPNVVLILADDLGYGDVALYHPHSKIPTPRIDRLAREAVRFTDAHTPSAVCTPTRYGLLTGRYSWRTPLKSGVLKGYSPALVEPGRLTLASLARERGYRTACIGKWHLGLGNVEPADYSRPLAPGPNAAGFHESFILPASLDFPPYVFVENERATALPSLEIGESKMRRHGGGGFWRAGAIAPEFRHADVLPALADRAIAFLQRQNGDVPFFLYFPLTAPHTPWMPSDEFRGRTSVGYYGDFVAQVDATVGRVLDVLDEQKLSADTLVIFTSDNGAHWLPEDIERFGHRANAEWRGQKADIWEGGHRVVLIVRWPGVVEGGTTSGRLVCLTDWLATMAEMFDRPLAAAEAEDSYSFLSVLTGEQSKWPSREAIVHQSGDGTLAIRAGAWKLCPVLGSHGFSAPRELKPVPGGPAGQLYDLVSDPGETTNRWLEEPETVARLESLLRRYQQQGYSRPYQP